MGVPAFFRWLCLRYPRIIQDAYNPAGDNHTMDVKEMETAGMKMPSNPEMDNLYLDMNGIIHPCTTGLHGIKPQTEA